MTNELLILAGGEQLLLQGEVTQEVLETAAQGPPGRDGVGGSVQPSVDPDNRTTLGSDGGIFTPELVADPLAYYILAKA